MSLFGPPNVEKMEVNCDVQGLIKALGYQKDAAIRRKAAYALGKIDDARAVEPLIIALKDSDGFVVREVAKSLGKLGDARAVAALLASPYDSQEELFGEVAYALGKLGVFAVEPLLAALKDPEKVVRMRAGKALGIIGDARAIEPLIASLKDLEKDVRQCATTALGSIGDARAFEPLLAALKDPEIDVRQYAAMALGSIGNADAIEPLTAALNDMESFRLRRCAASALGNIGGARAIMPLLAALKDPDINVRESAGNALRKIGAPAANPLLAASGLSIGIVFDILNNIGIPDAEWEQLDCQDESKRLILELLHIGVTEGFLSTKPGGKFNNEMRHIRAREIGYRLYQLGGFRLMQEVHSSVKKYFPLSSGAGRELEFAWDGVGEWGG